MSGLGSIAGQVQLMPGRPLPTVSSSRPQLAERVALGVAADALPQRLGAVFTLCSAAHQIAARRAVAAAQGAALESSIADAQRLRATQAREQVLRITHDWPRLWALHPVAAQAEAAAAALLRSCPLFDASLDPAAQVASLPGWIGAHWLGMAPEAWLAGHDADPAGWAARWCEAGQGTVAAALRARREAAMALHTPSRPLRLLDDAPRHLPELARRMAGDADFCARPDWAGSPADTGPWTRHHDPHRLPATSAWPRLVARVVDVLRLATAGGDQWLAQGALPLAPGEGVAWVEMARGLLVHWVRLERGSSGDRVVGCRVLAPTEWNFHPRGVLAEALSGLHGEAAATGARHLATAFDPCVEFVVHPPMVPHGEGEACTR
ncbi:hydrogenase formation protein [Ideonella sp. A 288]|uniref:hydrogenase formation protein n=1 Tax=Ideonella sp. A 288 TaxID=1962181 RepID=UPI000B4C1DFB|nr:hydrogenase formation protein [Ideonella sp. A 288]